MTYQKLTEIMLHATMESVHVRSQWSLDKCFASLKFQGECSMLALELVGPSVVHFASGCNVQPNRELTGHPIDRATRNSAQGYLISSHSQMWASSPLIPLAIFLGQFVLLGTCGVWESIWKKSLKYGLMDKITYFVWVSRGSMYLINDLNITENVDVLRILNLLINLSVSCIIFTHQFTLSYVK